jgi:hypothetical protein
VPDLAIGSPGFDEAGLKLASGFAETDEHDVVAYI